MDPRWGHRWLAWSRAGRSSYRVRERPRLSLPSKEGNLLTRGSTGSRRTWRACHVQLPPPMPSSGRVKRATSSLIRDPRGLLPAGSLDPSRSLVEGPRLARGPRTGAAERAPLTVASLGPDRRVTTVTASSRTPNAKLPSLYLHFDRMGSIRPEGLAPRCELRPCG